MIYCGWHAPAATRAVCVLGILELPGVVTLAFAQAGKIVVCVQVLEDAGEDLRQPLWIVNPSAALEGM